MNGLQLAGALVSALALVLFYYLMALSKQSPQKRLGADFKMPDVRVRYAPAVLFQTFEAAGEDGLREMRRYWLYDFGLMAGLTGVMVAVSANIADAGTWLFRLMVLLSLVRTAVDIAEDALFLTLLRRYPRQPNGMAALAAVVTTCKHMLLFAWIGILFVKLLLSAFHISL